MIKRKLVVKKDDVSMLLVISIFFVLTSIIYLIKLPHIEQKLLVNILFLVFPFITVSCGIYAAKGYGLKNVHGRSILYITLGLASLFVGEVMYAFYEIFLKYDPYPSFADIFYIVSYPLILYGIYHELKTYNTEISPLKSLIVSFFSVIISIIVFYIMIFPVFRTTESILEKAIAIGYGIGDLLLILGVLHILLLIVDFKGGRLYHAWLYMLIGTIFMLLGDIFYALYYEQYKLFLPQFKMIDLLWIASYSFFTVGLLELRFIVRDVQTKLKQLL